MLKRGIQLVYSSFMVLLTGGTGILGMRMTYDLLAKGAEVGILVRKDSDKKTFFKVIEFYHGSDAGRFKERIRWFEGDILDVDSLQLAITAADRVIHAAAIVSFHPRDAALMYETNRMGTANVVNGCLNLDKRLLYVSSVAALGRNTEHKTINEKSTWKDGPLNSKYAISKYNAELEVWRGMEEGLDAVIMNPSIIIGAGPVNKSSGTLYGSVIQGNRFYTEGIATAVDVRDVSEMGIALLDSDQQAQRFIMHSQQISYKEMFAEMAKGLGLKAPDIQASNWMLALGWRIMSAVDFIFRSKSRLTKETAMSSMNDYDYDNTKIQALLGKGFIPVREAIAYHAAYYRSSSAS